MSSEPPPYSRVSVFEPGPPELGQGGWKPNRLALLNRGFRPFFLGAGVWAIAATGMLAARSWTPGGTSGGAPGWGPAPTAAWHAHEHLFGYGSALLAGFLLTAVPNWTGRRPLTGLPLLGLFALWLAGRLALLPQNAFGSAFAAIADIAFLPLIFVIAVREIIVAKNWRNLKTVGLLGLFVAAHAWFLTAQTAGADVVPAFRLGVAALIALVMLIDGRVAPHFARLWLTSIKARRLPADYDWYDNFSLVVAGLALAAWVAAPELAVTAGLLAAAGLAHAVRLVRWRGHTVWRRPMILILHVGYAFVPLGFLLVAAAAVAPDLVPPAAALHAWTTGAVGATALGIMTRATRTHTGRRAEASVVTTLAYTAVAAAALLRIVAGPVTGLADVLVPAAIVAWIAAHLLFLAEYGPMMLTGRKKRR